MKDHLLGLFLFLTFTLGGKAPELKDKDLNRSPTRVIRTCCAIGSNLKFTGIPFVRRTDIITKDELGIHKYLGGRGEGNGIVYTLKGGFIDVGHLRDYADWTAYLYNQIRRNKSKLDDLEIKLGAEGGPKSLLFKVVEEKQNLDYVELAGSIAYDLSLWHEIATYFGVSLIPIVPERFSSFSPEDVYSNLLGAVIGMEAIKSEFEYNEAVTMILARTLEELEAVSTFKGTQNAMDQVEQIWWDSEIPLPNRKFLLKRNLDTEHSLKPWLVPNEHLNQEGYVLEKPDISYSDLYDIRIRLNDKFPIASIMGDAKKRDITQRDFRRFVEYIKGKDILLNKGLTEKQITKQEKQVKRMLKKQN